MAIYYVNLDSPGAWNGRGGTNHTGDEWLGLSGLQKAADTITAGNSIHIKGTTVCTNLLDVSHDAWSGTALTRGEACSWAGGTGVVSEPNTGASDGIVIEKLTGNNPIDNETITGTTSGQTVTVDASASSVKATGLDVDTNIGSIANGVVKYIGLNSSWVNDGTRCKLDGNAGAIAGCLNIIYYSANYQYFENIEVDDADNDGFGYSNSYYTIFKNCWTHHCDRYGIMTPYQGKMINCLASNNGSYGFMTTTYTQFIMCVTHTNSNGSYPSAGNSFIGCIAAENNNVGIYTGTGGLIMFCVADENADGIKADGSVAILCNRITNQSDDGIDSASKLNYEDWNLFYNNTGDNYHSPAGTIVQGGNSKINSASDGYTDQAGHDFNLTDSADYRREAITLPKWDGTSP